MAGLLFVFVHKFRLGGEHPQLEGIPGQLQALPQILPGFLRCILQLLEALFQLRPLALQFRQFLIQLRPVLVLGLIQLRLQAINIQKASRTTSVHLSMGRNATPTS